MNHSNRIVLVVVLFIGINSTLLCGGLLYLAWSKVAVDAALIGLAGTALGSLGTLLATTRGAPSQDTSSTPAGTDTDPLKIAAVTGEAVDVAPQAPEPEPGRDNEEADDTTADHFGLNRPRSR